MNITFIGGGNMANALIGGMLGQGFAKTDIRVVEPNADTAGKLRAQYGISVFDEANAESLASDLIMLAVKPQVMKAVAQGIAPLLDKQLVVSIAAGIRAADLSRWLGGHQRLVRAMPNTPAMVLSGVTGLYAMAGVSTEERGSAQRVLEAVGAVVWVDDESGIDTITAVSGSGPAYVFYFMEGLEEAAIAQGLSAEQARSLSLATFAGAAKLAAQSADDVATLRARVTSKGGTTERAIHTMEGAQLKQIIIDAVRAAAQRSKELGDELGSA